MLLTVRTADFNFDLPPELIAQKPASRRDLSRLLVLRRDSEAIEHRKFCNLVEYLSPGDVLVLNNSRVIAARLRGRNTRSGGKFEILLLEENKPNDWWAMLRPGKRASVGARIQIQDRHGQPANLQADVIEVNAEGHRRLLFRGMPDILETLPLIGEVPLPPYIARRDGNDMAEDRCRYQTVYADPAGSVAAPTAGLHFTESLLSQIRSLGVQVCFLTLHVGLGTFAPVKAEMVARHVMHEERFDLPAETAAAVSSAKGGGRRVFAVGTTTVRVLESIATQNAGSVLPGAGRTSVFIYPPYAFQIIDGLVTNFHLPRSTLLMLASAFAAPGGLSGRERVLRAYAEAIKEGYRFFSYGDAMLIL